MVKDISFSRCPILLRLEAVIDVGPSLSSLSSILLLAFFLTAGLANLQWRLVYCQMLRSVPSLDFFTSSRSYLWLISIRNSFSYLPYYSQWACFLDKSQMNKLIIILKIHNNMHDHVKMCKRVTRAHVKFLQKWHFTWVFYLIKIFFSQCRTDGNDTEGWTNSVDSTDFKVTSFEQITPIDSSWYLLKSHTLTTTRLPLFTLFMNFPSGWEGFGIHDTSQPLLLIFFQRSLRKAAVYSQPWQGQDGES